MVKAIHLSLAIGLLGSLRVKSDTEYTGDIINGHRIITKLDLNDFPLNSSTKLWLQMPRQQTGQAFHVPVIIARGQQDGNRLLVNSGIHGDELNGIRTVQRLMKDIDLSKLKGSVVGIPGSNVNGMYESTSRFVNKADSGSHVNLNRQFSGNTTTSSLGERYARQLWTGIFGVNNFTAAVDFHTPSTSTVYPNFVYADFTTPYVARMAELTGADIVKIDTGETAQGSLENALDRLGIPTITYELGTAKLWQRDQIQKSYDYLFRLLADLKMYPPNTDSAAVATYDQLSRKTYYGNEIGYVGTRVGGFLEVYTKPMDHVKKDQIIGTMYNVFGDRIQDFSPAFDGIMVSIETNPLKAVGNLLFEVIHNSTDPKCVNGC